MKVAVIYHEDFGSKGHSVLKARIKPSFEALARSGLLEGDDVQVFEPEPAPLELVERAHTPEHMESMRTESYNRQYHDVALLSAGSVLLASEMVAGGEAENAFAYTGTAGHHASPGSCWGFCYYNDVVISIMRLRELGLSRFLIVDVDPHFGDGTRNFFGDDRDVYHINFNHQQSSNFDEKNNNYDVGIGFDAGDDQFLSELERSMEMAKGFDFSICFVVFGHDSHADDYGGFELTSAVYAKMARIILEAAGGKGVVFVLSGGSVPEVASKAIPDVISVLAGR
ncbi:histone deacetylase [Methanocrinis sp.]|uniref:histone deacetylase n=1 Tax=Methanocrinis sp. TaxID=3101522 RepID=UPI003D1163E2